MNAKIIKSLATINTAIEELISCLSDEEATAKVAPAPVKSDKTKTTEKKTPAKAAEADPDTDGEITEEYLEGLSYNNLKKLAKQLGITAVGAREELVEKILTLNGGEADGADEADDDDEDDKPAKTSPKKSAPAKKPLGKKSAPEPEPEDEDEDDEDEEEDPIVTSVNEAVKDMTDEEIADFLTDVGIRAKGKRQALIAAVVKAVREGKIELDDEDEEEENPVRESRRTDSKTKAPDKKSKKSKNEPEEEEDEDEKESDDINDPDNEDMTDERREAIREFTSEAQEQFDSGELTRKDIVSWLTDMGVEDKSSCKSMTDDELFERYVYVSCLFIDDEGEMNEEGGYTVNGVPYCCGAPLKYSKDTKTYICEACGSEYEA